MKFLAKLEGTAFLLMRLVFGFLIACHGSQKIFGVPGGHRVTAPLMLVAGAIELIGGGLVFLGLFTRQAAFVVSGEMAVAYFMQHGSRGFFPILNGGELAVAYCFAFLYIATHGSGGRFSFDR
jgi:putative oxidoreductase